MEDYFEDHINTEDEKKYINNCTFKIIGYGMSTRECLADKNNIIEMHSCNVHHIYLRSTHDYRNYDLQFYYSIICCDFSKYIFCNHRLINVNNPKYITHTLSDDDEITVKYQYKLNSVNIPDLLNNSNETDKNNTNIVVNENDRIIDCKLFNYCGGTIYDVFKNNPDHSILMHRTLLLGSFTITTNKFQEIINTKSAIKKSNNKNKKNEN